MRLTIKATLIDHTPSIDAYVEKKLKELERLLDKKDTSIHAEVEVGLRTRHHKNGEVFFAEINLSMMKKLFRAVSEAGTLYAAIDDMKDAIVDEVTSAEKKARTLAKRGGRKIKRAMRGE